MRGVDALALVMTTLVMVTLLVMTAMGELLEARVVLVFGWMGGMIAYCVLQEEDRWRH